MRRILSWIGFFVLVSLIYSEDSHSQTRAGDWVKIGLDAASADAKIRAFEQAIQLDPNYVEAYYYLGLAYKSRGRFEEAETTLNKAYFKNPFALNNDIKTRILFELGSIYQQLGKTDKAKEALLGAKGLTSAASAKGRICYDLGQIYLKEGNISSALIELREGKSLLPQNGKLFDEAIQLAENKKNLDDRYNDSLSLMRTERYEDALRLLREILQTDPNFKDTASKLAEATSLGQQSNTNKRLASLYSQAMKKSQAGEINEAIGIFREVANIDPDYKDVELRLQQLQNQRRRTAPVSNNSSIAMNDRPERVGNLQPPVPILTNGRSAAIASEPLYDEGVGFLKGRDWQAALDSFEKLKSTKPNYRDLDDLIQSARDSLAHANQSESTRLYEDGLAALQNGDWKNAAEAFEKVQRRHPGFQDVKNKLADARFNLNKKGQQKVMHHSVPDGSLNLATAAGVAVALLTLPILGIFVFSPMTRARLYLLQSKYDRAAAIYEKLLARSPGKIKLYPMLAQIYLLENRRDERALKIYETIVRQNILTNKREAINSILAAHYLHQGRTDSSAIQILEKELDTKMRKLKVYP